MRRLPAGLLLSFTAHAALVLGLVAIVEQAASPVLFVDLVTGFGLASGRGAGGGGSSGAPEAKEPAPAPAAAVPQPPRPAHPHAVARARPVPPRASAPASVAPAASAPVPAPEPPRVAATEIIVAPVAPPAPPPAPVAAAPVAPPAPAVAAAPSAPSTPAPASGAGAADAMARASAGGAGTPGATGRESGAPIGQGDSGSGGGRGAGAGAWQGSTVALAVPGDGVAVPPEYQGYYDLLRERVREAARYPAVARRRSLTGRVELELDVAPSGALSDVVLAVSSSHDVLDREAIDAVRRLGRVPFPAGLPPRHFRLRVPVDFFFRAEP